MALRAVIGEIIEGSEITVADIYPNPALLTAIYPFMPSQ